MAQFNFVLPFLPTKPVGGVKNLFQFANRLAAKGHQVTIFCAVQRPFKKSKTPVWFRLLINRLSLSRVGWFDLHSTIKLKVIPALNDRYIPDAQATLSTWWQMAYALASLNTSKGIKINFIQDYELWIGQEEAVHASYKLPVRHVVIARYLEKLVFEQSGKKPTIINTPIDTKKFIKALPVEERKAATVMMMYSEEPRKGSEFGLKALSLLKEKVHELEVTLFSVYDRPAHIPVWMNYYQRPHDLVSLYNQHAIFISPSLGEGWALPPAEAMACGCAVVCTNIGGHQDYARHMQTAWLVEPQNPDMMAKAIEALINNQTLKNTMATSGYQFIKSFDWDEAVNQLEAILLNKA
ncbi:MAG: glycosyltransferase [Bacteroidetes bacterium CHB5]|nr:glycosyltransferase [Bacteroidetes bacterium CHB5]